MASDTFLITGEVNVQITITEMTDGTLQFDVTVLDETGSIGDLNALYFDISDNSLVDGLTVTGDDVTGSAFKVDGVTKVDSFTNMNGEVVKDLGKFDGGVQFGTQGIGTDDIRSTSFILSSDAGALTLDNFSLMDFGVRLTSVGAEDGSRDGSLKLGGTAPELEGEDPEPPVAVCDDTGTFTFQDAFNPVIPGIDFPTDQTDTFEFSLLANNSDANAIVAVADGDVGVAVDGSNGGSIIIYADGSFDFSAQDTSGNNAFDGLVDANDTAMTDFAYTMDNGDSVLFCVTVTGVGGGDGGPMDGF